VLIILAAGAGLTVVAAVDLDVQQTAKRSSSVCRALDHRDDHGDGDA
jgi:hypothetical protein